MTAEQLADIKERIEHLREYVNLCNKHGIEHCLTEFELVAIELMTHIEELETK